MSSARPRRYIPPRAARAALLAGLTALAGSLVLRLAQPPDNSGSRLWGTLYLTVGINSDERLDSGLRQRASDSLTRFSRDFRELHPGVDFQLMTFPEEELAHEPCRSQADR